MNRIRQALVLGAVVACAAGCTPEVEAHAKRVYVMLEFGGEDVPVEVSGSCRDPDGGLDGTFSGQIAGGRLLLVKSASADSTTTNGTYWLSVVIRGETVNAEGETSPANGRHEMTGTWSRAAVDLGSATMHYDYTFQTASGPLTGQEFFAPPSSELGNPVGNSSLTLHDLSGLNVDCTLPPATLRYHGDGMRHRSGADRYYLF